MSLTRTDFFRYLLCFSFGFLSGGVIGSWWAPLRPFGVAWPLLCGLVALIMLPSSAAVRDRNNDVSERLKPSTVNRELDCLKAILSEAVEWKKLLDSPLAA